MAVFVQSSSFLPSQVPLEYFHLLSLSVVTSHKAHLHQIQLLTRTVSLIVKVFFFLNIFSSFQNSPLLHLIQRTCARQPFQVQTQNMCLFLEKISDIWFHRGRGLWSPGGSLCERPVPEPSTSACHHLCIFPSRLVHGSGIKALQ